MYAKQLFCSYVLALAMATASSAEDAQSRYGRRVPPPGDQPIGLTELEFACTVQGWYNCRNMTSSLLNPMHRLNLAITSCIDNHSPYPPRPSEPPTYAPANLTEIAGSWENQTEVSETGSGSGDLNTTSDTISNITGSYSNSSDLAGGVTGGAVGEQDEMRCPISGEEKKQIRREVYCHLLFEMDKAVRTIVSPLCFLRDYGCVSYYSEEGYLTPSQLITSIRIWHEAMISTHKKCCETHSNSTFSRDLDDLYGNKLPVRIGELAVFCPLAYPRLLWDHGLGKIALLVHMLDLIQGLGRRKMCLRGCVSENQVYCTNLLPYLLI